MKRFMQFMIQLQVGDESARAKVRVLNYIMVCAILMGFFVVGQMTRNPDKNAYAFIMDIAKLPIWLTMGDNNNNCNPPDIVDNGPIELCPGTSYNITGNPDSGTVSWSVSQGSDKLSINQEGLVTWSSYNSSNWGTDFTGKVRLSWSSNPDCYEEITINGKGFKRPGSLTNFGNLFVYIGTLSGTLSSHPLDGSGDDDSNGWLGWSYQDNNDCCNGLAQDRYCEVYTGTGTSFQWSISRTIEGYTLGLDANIAWAWKLREGTSGSAISESNGKSLVGAPAIPVYIGYENVTVQLPSGGSFSASGSDGPYSDHAMIQFSGDYTHNAGDTLECKMFFYLGIGNKAHRDHNNWTHYSNGGNASAAYPTDNKGVTWHP